MEHILKIRLQLEELKSEDIGKKFDPAAKKINEALTTAYQRAAKDGGEAMIEGMTKLQKAWKQFDWGHPIQSFKNLFGGAVDWIKNRFGLLGGVVIGLVGLMVSVFKSLAEPQAELVRTFSMLNTRVDDMGQYGVKMGDKVGRALEEVAEIAIVTGERMDVVARRFAQLAQARVPIKEVKSLTQAAYLGAKALGANVDQMTEFIGTLRVMGRLNTDQITGRRGIIQSFSAIQDAVGLTEKEMTGLISTTTELTRYMKAFGASADAIFNMAEATAKLTGLFGQLGLGADRASEIMNKLFDPTQLGENAYLIRSMGFSMQEYLDMLAGGAVDQRKLTAGLIDAAKEISNMQAAGVHVLALQQRAQMMGFKNAAEALRLAKEGPTILGQIEEATKGGVDWGERAAEGMATLNDVLGRVRNRFMAFFGKMAAPLIGKLTNVIAALEKKWIENESVIRKVFESLTEGVVTFIKNLDIKKIIAGFQAFINVLKNLVEHWRTIAIIGGLVLGVFAGFKILGTIVPMVSNLTGVFKGLAGGLKGIGAASQGASGAAQGMSTFMKFLMKAAIGVGILFLLASAIWVLAQALKTFSKEIDWAGMLKAGVAIIALTALMFGLGLLFATPVGMAAIAGAIAFAAALLLLGAAMWVIAKAIKAFTEALDPKKLMALSELATPELTEGLKAAGKAIMEFVGQFKMLALMKAPFLIVLGAAIKDFALGLWVLGEIKNLKTASASLSVVSDAVKELSQGGFRNNARVIADTIKALSDALATLSKIQPENFAQLAPSMIAVAKGFSAWISALTGEGKGKGFLDRLGDAAIGMLVKFQPMAAAFKDLALAVWVLGEAEGRMGTIGTTMKTLPILLSDMAKNLSTWNQRDVIKGTEQFIRFMNALSGTPTNIATNVTATGTAKLKTEVGEVNGVQQAIKITFEEQTNRLIDKLDNIFGGEWQSRERDMAGALQSIARNTRR